MYGDPLAAYYTRSPRYSSQLGGRQGVRGQVDALLNELQIPATLDADGDWNLTNDAGNFTLFVRESDQRVVVRQVFNRLASNLKKHAGLMHALLLMNLDNEGACFASQDATGGGYVIVLTGQKPYDRLNREELLELLGAAFKLSNAVRPRGGGRGGSVRRPDRASPGPRHCRRRRGSRYRRRPSPSPPPGRRTGTPDPHGQARLRYWDGSALHCSTRPDGSGGARAQAPGRPRRADAG